MEVVNKGRKKPLDNFSQNSSTSLRMGRLKSKSQTVTSFGQDVGKSQPSFTTGDNGHHCGKWSAVLQKIKHKITVGPRNSTPSYISKKKHMSSKGHVHDCS
jgi:hypothetical protein